MIDQNTAAATTDTAAQTERVLTISREANDVYVAMQCGLGLTRIMEGLGITRAAVLSRQNNLEKLGIISKGSMDGTRRAILLPASAFRVEAEHRSTVRARNLADRAAADAKFQADWAALEADGVIDDALAGV